MEHKSEHDIFFLGAGKPASGDKPAALKEIGANVRALDWQLHSLTPLHQPKIHFLGGYHIEEVIEHYPQLHYTVIPDWQHHSVIHTLLAAPLRKTQTYIIYTDTVFRENIIKAVEQKKADVVLVYDSLWRHRYENRSEKDLALAEVVSFSNGEPDFNLQTPTENFEFTGLVKFSAKATQFISTLKEADIGRTLLDLIRLLAQNDFSIAGVDAHGEWAEFNSPLDIAHFVLGTKAETLARLAPLVRHSQIGQQVCFTVNEWKEDPKYILDKISTTFPATELVVRSSAKGEDNWKQSNAGGYTSLLNVDSLSPTAITKAIETVFASYHNAADHDQILVQEFLENVQFCGVVFTRSLETGAPYYRINFDDQSLSTESVTSGTSNNLRTFLISRANAQQIDFIEPKLTPVLNAIQELESLLGYDRLDIEFAVDDNHHVHIFQVRPITVDHSEFEIDDQLVFANINNSIANFYRMQPASPFIVGTHAIFGVMPDWNPAEIIGTRPRPLAFSLYRFLITEEIWAQQRAEFGYRDVRPHPLIVAFCEQPYVDIRASLNSFIPATVSKELAEKLVNAYTKILAANPQFHDKLEFEVAFTVWTPTFIQEALARLRPYGITTKEIVELEMALKALTQKAFRRLENDIAPAKKLAARRQQLEDSALSPLDKALALLEDCKRFGTLAFAHAARAGFVATSYLRSFIAAKVLTVAEKNAFLHSFKTIAGEFEEDAYKVALGELSPEQYVAHYGHLRPGTYDINIEAYWEAPERYLFPKTVAATKLNRHETFEFSLATTESISQALEKININISYADFIHYLTSAIQAREAVKFEFTRNLSRALDYFTQYGQEVGLSRDALSYLHLDDLQHVKNGNFSVNTLHNLIKQRRKDFLLTQMIELPQLILSETDFYCFERRAAQPNFVTHKSVKAPVVILNKHEPQAQALSGNIVLIPQADPGYDWLFAHSIAGLITKYGGANSHMAIRAAEMALPAAIGVGDKLYDEISQSNFLHLDCGQQQIIYL